VDECPAYRRVVERQQGMTHGVERMTMMLMRKCWKLSHKHINVPAAQSCMLIVATSCDCAVIYTS